MAEAVIVSIAEEIFAVMGSQAIETVGKLWGVKDELKALRDIVSMLQPVLDHAEEKYDQTPLVRVWVEKLKDAFYEARDVLEEFNIEAIRRELRGHNEMIKEVRTFFSSSNQIAFQFKMRNKVRAVTERIQAIKADRKFHLVERPVDARVDREWRKREETHSFVCVGDIIGRDDDKNKVMEFLLDSDMEENVSILPIVGIGGLGKTAVAQYVYNDEMVSKHFNLKMWVCVSDVFDVKEILKKMIACATKKEPTEDTMELLQSKLRAEIDEKRYLLVLDDLWNDKLERWLSLRKLLMGGARGSKILITTRLSSVARITGTTPPHFLRGLSKSASVDLLMKMARRKIEEIQGSDMRAIIEEIVRKCSGVPLVVRTVGGLLRFKKTELEWSQFKENELPDVAQREDSIKYVLRLSYDHLPSHLKQCFALCSLFPKDYEIRKEILINLWMAEGFIQPSDRNQHLEDIAHRYFMDLLWSNFFQDFEKDPYTNEGTCKMHDLMHDLACSVAGTECWVAWDDKKSILERTRHISHDLTSNLIGKLPMSRSKTTALRTFLSTAKEWVWVLEYRESMSEADLRQLIQSFKRLRILDLHTTNIEKVPRSICKLKHLTYLNLSHNVKLKRLPSAITRLQNLQTLNLHGCRSLEELLSGIRKLVSLRNLDIDDCYRLSYLPHGLGQLSSLHRLTRFILPKDQALGKNYCKLEELNGLNNIRGSLCIENLGSVTDAVADSRAANLIEKHSLESLTLNFHGATTWDKEEALLEELQPPSNLQKLRIDEYKGERFPRWMMDSLLSSLPNLIELHFKGCRRCNHLPPLGQLPHLMSLGIYWMSELEYIESDHSSTSTTSFPSLLKLQILGCEKLKAMPPTPHLEDLALYRPNSALINHLFGLNKLKRLFIASMEFPECLPEECLKSLTSLEFLHIYRCHQLTSLSSLGMRHLSRLVNLRIEDCKELDLCIEDESGGNILDFHGGLLHSLPSVDLSKEDEGDSNILDFHGGLLHSLRSVFLFDLPKLESLPRWLLQASNLESLQISGCYNLKELPEQIGDLQSLQQLHIRSCPLLTSLPEGMRRLAFLALLNISACPKLEERCKRDGGEDWYKIAHIPHITHNYYF